MPFLICLSLLPLLGWAESRNGSRSITPKTGSKPLKIPLGESRPKSAEGFYPIDGDGDGDEGATGEEAAPSSKKTVRTQDDGDVESGAEPSLEDFPGETVAGIPRLIRASPETEVFFRDLNLSYIIPQDSKHNRFFNAFDQASKLSRQVSFRVDPVSRRVLAMDGVDGVRAPAKAAASSSGTPGSK